MYGSTILFITAILFEFMDIVILNIDINYRGIFRPYIIPKNQSKLSNILFLTVHSIIWSLFVAGLLFLYYIEAPFDNLILLVSYLLVNIMLKYITDKKRLENSSIMLYQDNKQYSQYFTTLLVTFDIIFLNFMNIATKSIEMTLQSMLNMI